MQSDTVAFFDFVVSSLWTTVEDDGESSLSVGLLRRRKRLRWGIDAPHMSMQMRAGASDPVLHNSITFFRLMDLFGGPLFCSVIPYVPFLPRHHLYLWTETYCEDCQRPRYSAVEKTSQSESLVRGKLSISLFFFVNNSHMRCCALILASVRRLRIGHEASPMSLQNRLLLWASASAKGLEGAQEGLPAEIS
jgi:hypothetical protein